MFRFGITLAGITLSLLGLTHARGQMDVKLVACDPRGFENGAPSPPFAHVIATTPRGGVLQFFVDFYKARGEPSDPPKRWSEVRSVKDQSKEDRDPAIGEIKYQIPEAFAQEGKYVIRRPDTARNRLTVYHTRGIGIVPAMLSFRGGTEKALPTRGMTLKSGERSVAIPIERDLIPVSAVTNAGASASPVTMYGELSTTIYVFHGNALIPLERGTLRGAIMPNWSPDGLFVVCSVPSNQTLVCFEIINDVPWPRWQYHAPVGTPLFPVWSPDGRRIAFQNVIDAKRSELWMLELQNVLNPGRASKVLSSDAVGRVLHWDRKEGLLFELPDPAADPASVKSAVGPPLELFACQVDRAVGPPGLLPFAFPHDWLHGYNGKTKDIFFVQHSESRSTLSQLQPNGRERSINAPLGRRQVYLWPACSPTGNWVALSQVGYFQ